MIRIAFDLEIEQPSSNPNTPDSKLIEPEIIQVGWVVFEDSPFTILSSECYEINIGVPLSDYIKKLTKIADEQIQNGKTLHEVYQKLADDRKAYKASRILIQWGGGDDIQLKKELGYPSSWPFGRSSRNVKHLFQDWAYKNNISQSGGLHKSLKKLGLTFKEYGGGEHNAVADAYNTAVIYSFLLNKINIDSKPKQ